MPTRRHLAVEAMSDVALWNGLIRLVKQLDPKDASYDFMKTHHEALTALEIALELRKRGTQLPLFTA